MTRVTAVAITVFLIILVLIVGNMGHASEHAEVLRILKTHSAKGAVPAKLLAKEVMFVSKLYKIDPIIYAKIIMVESRGRANAFNPKSKDYGIAQINHRVATNLGVTDGCLKEWRCNLIVGAFILKKKPRPCGYNLGYRIKTRMQLCSQYEQKLANLDI